MGHMRFLKESVGPRAAINFEIPPPKLLRVLCIVYYGVTTFWRKLEKVREGRRRLEKV